MSKELEKVDVVEKVEDVGVEKKSTPKKKKPQVEDVKNEEVKEEVKKVEEVEKELPPHVIQDEIPKTPKKKKTLPEFGTVVNCNKLRIREGASVKSKELLVIDVGSKIKINHEESTESFYAVEYNSVIGFCVKDYIKLD